MKTASRALLLNVAAVLLLVAAATLCIYQFIYKPIVAGKWFAALTVVAGSLFWLALMEVARRKTENTDYRRN